MHDAGVAHLQALRPRRVPNHCHRRQPWKGALRLGYQAVNNTERVDARAVCSCAAIEE